MRKFLLSLLLLAVVLPLSLRAEEIIVGTGSTSSNVVPFNNMKTDSYIQSIYPMEEIGGAKTITAVAFSCNTPDKTATSNVEIYIGETDKNTHVNQEDWITDLTLVYEGAVTLGGEEWENFTFNTSYNYSGEKNLVIAVSTSGTTAANQVIMMTLKWNTVTEYDYNRSMVNSVVSSEPADSPSPKYFRPIIRLTVVDEEGGDDESEEPEEITPTLEAPVVEATATSATTIELSWNAVADSALYQVYIGEEWIGSTYETSFVVNNCDPATITCCSVVATKDGVESAHSEEACAMTPQETQQPEETVPSAPVLTCVKTTASTVVLSWEEVEGATSYKVYYYQEESPIATDVIVTTYTVEGLTVDTEYSFIVTAVNAAGESAISNVVTVTTTEEGTEEEPTEPEETVPAPPTLTSVVTNDTIHLYWDFMIGVINYTLYYGEQILVQNINVNDTAYDIHVPVPGTYCFTVTATNGIGESEHSNEVCAEVKADSDLEIPAVPVITAAVVNDSAVVKWEAVEGATYYNVYLVQEEGLELIKATETTEAKFAIKNQGSYCFVVKSGNLAGLSENSNEACITYGEGIEENAASFNIYPNPVNDKIYIETESEIKEVVVYDVYGRVQNLRNSETQQLSNSIDVTDLNSGVYFVKVVTENGESVKRIIKN